MKKINTLIVIVTFLFLTACGGGKIEGTWKPDTSGMGEMEKKMAEGAKLTSKKRRAQLMRQG